MAVLHWIYCMCEWNRQMMVDNDGAFLRIYYTLFSCYNLYLLLTALTSVWMYTNSIFEFVGEKEN